MVQFLSSIIQVAITIISCLLGLALCACRSLLSWVCQRWKSVKRQHRPQQTYSATTGGVISIIIVVLNDSRFIGKCLRNLELCTTDKSRLEVLIVDAGCQDNTLEVAKVSANQIPLIFVKHGKGEKVLKSLETGREAS